MTSDLPPSRDEPLPDPSAGKDALASVPVAAPTREMAPAEPVYDGEVVDDLPCAVWRSIVRRFVTWWRRSRSVPAALKSCQALTWWIRQSLSRALADQARTIRIPVHMTEMINKLSRIRRELRQDLGREPTPAELATELDITPEKVLEIQQHARDPISLDQTIGDEGDSQLGDFIEDSQAVVALDAVSFTLLQDQLRCVLGTLSEREASIVGLRFGLTDGQPRTLDEIGHVHGVTRERIRQIETKTMSKLRHPSRSHALRDYLG